MSLLMLIFFPFFISWLWYNKVKVPLGDNHFMDTYRILTTEYSTSGYGNLNDLAMKLKQTAPHIDWVLEKVEIMIYNDKKENQLSLKIPIAQYEAAKYLYSLVSGTTKDIYKNDPFFKSVKEGTDYLAHYISYPVEEDEIDAYLNTLLKLLSDIYLNGTQMPQGVNLYLPIEFEEPYGHFANEWELDDEFLLEEMFKLGENIDYILYETTKFYPFEEPKNNMLLAGIVYELYQSFHSLDGWGMEVLETIKFIHQLKNKRIHEQSNESPSLQKEPNLKIAAVMWLRDRIIFDRILQRDEFQLHILTRSYDSFAIHPDVYSFPLKGFADEPEVFVLPTQDGLKFGYHTIRWDGPHTPTPTLAIKHVLSWETLEDLSQEEKETKVIDTFFKTIDSRKRQYKTCQFCCEKFPPERRFNTKTCFGCATEHFGVIY